MLRKQKGKKVGVQCCLNSMIPTMFKQKLECIKTRRKYIKMLRVILWSLNSYVFSKPFIIKYFFLFNQKRNLTFVCILNQLPHSLIARKWQSERFNLGLLSSLGSFWQNYQFWHNPYILQNLVIFISSHRLYRRMRSSKSKQLVEVGERH